MLISFSLFLLPVFTNFLNKKLAKNSPTPFQHATSHLSERYFCTWETCWYHCVFKNSKQNPINIFSIFCTILSFNVNYGHLYSPMLLWKQGILSKSAMISFISSFSICINYSSSIPSTKVTLDSRRLWTICQHLSIVSVQRISRWNVSYSKVHLPIFMT